MSERQGPGIRDQGPGGTPRPDARTEALYQELILDHYRRPRNRGPVTGADRAAERRNPLCGDAIAVELALDGERVREAGFTGQGCSITQAAASMLTGALRGLTLGEARALLARYDAMIGGDPAALADVSLGELRALSGVARFPARLRCALLPAEALEEALRV
ncbi:MAG TPA: SUF system NifU family Fe-S cluster assembly protein [Gemmatimonadales bacterium]